MVKCIKLGQELPGLSRPPVPGELGRRIYEQVSEDAWKMFKEHFKMIINEYRLDLMSKEADEIFNRQVEEYFFKDVK
jgi:Fe-S cluster biosynthesis and repair protein YggX